MEWLILPILVAVGYEYIASDEPTEQPQIVEVHQPAEEENIYARGKYYLSENGYYISNLTPPPLVVEGCDLPIVVGDLSEKMANGEKRDVTVQTVNCEG